MTTRLRVQSALLVLRLTAHIAFDTVYQLLSGRYFSRQAPIAPPRNSSSRYLTWVVPGTIFALRPPTPSLAEAVLPANGDIPAQRVSAATLLSDDIIADLIADQGQAIAV